MTLISLIRKEFQQLRHNPFTIYTILFYVFVITLVQPLLLTLDVKSVTVAVVDKDASELSRRVAESIGHTEQLRVTYYGSDIHTANVMLDEGLTHCIIEIPAGFERNVIGGKTGLAEPQRINISTDAVNSMRGIQGTAFVTGCITSAIKAYAVENGMDMGQDDEVVETLLYNPSQDYRNFVIPTVFFLFITYICGIFLTAAVCDEKMRGTIEQINVCPISRSTYVWSKILTYSIISMMAFYVDMGLIAVVYDVVPNGGIVAMSLAIFLFSVCVCAIAITAGNLAANTIQAVMAVFFINYIMQVMSGFLTPIECMPDWLQPVTLFIPLRYTVATLRNGYLKGANVIEMWQQLACLVTLTIVCVLFAVRSYKRVED